MTRQRPRKTITLSQKAITYVETTANQNNLSFSAAVEAIITEHTNGIGAALLTAAIGTTDPATHLEHLPSVVQKSSQWT